MPGYKAPKKSAVAVTALIAVGALLVIFHQPIIQFFAKAITPKDNRSQLATVEAFHGDVDLKPSESLESAKAIQGSLIRHQDTLIVGNSSQAIVRFKNDMVIEVQSQSSVFFEQLDYVLVSIQRGGLKVLEKGTGQHEVILLKDGLLQDPEGRNIPAASLLKGDTIEDDEPESTPPPPSQDRQTLSDAYISSVVQNQKGFMNRCYAQHLRNQPQSKGEIHLTFTIQPAGDVTAFKVLKSTIDDKELQRCVLSALERAKFRAFEGNPIIVNYPIFFE